MARKIDPSILLHTRLYPNMGHTVELDEIDFIVEMMAILDA